VPDGRPVAIGGSTVELHERTRQILGLATGRNSSESIVTLTATVLE
jgi:hypothetical protein